jgi:hypothetical protein
MALACPCLVALTGAADYVIEARPSVPPATNAESTSAITSVLMAVSMLVLRRVCPVIPSSPTKGRHSLGHKVHLNQKGVCEAVERSCDLLSYEPGG